MQQHQKPTDTNVKNQKNKKVKMELQQTLTKNSNNIKYQKLRTNNRSL